ncbi:MAG: ROK family protein [Chloroflexi bacterium]|nr:ROK family protein [Chloroflexota bacterium]
MPRIKKATREYLKEHNRSLVFKHLFDHDSISRAEIARITGLTPTTVSDIISDLLDEDLVQEVGVGVSIGGKNPILLSLVEDSRWLIGLDLAQNQFRGAVVNLRGKIRQMVSLPVNDRDGDEALKLVYEILDRLIENAEQPIQGIGVGTPGLVNTSQGVVLNAVNLNWKNLPLEDLLRQRYRLPVYVVNDSQAAAIGEYTYGKDHRTDDNLVVINARHGIGAGIIINGALYYGDGGSAGEIGHIVVVPEGGLPCRCGKHGCLETVASAQALVNRLRSLASQHPSDGLPRSAKEITLDAIEEAFVCGDELARQEVLETGRYFGLAISSLVGILNIHKIVVSGDMARFGEDWLDAVKDAAAEMSLPGLVKNTQIQIGELGSNGIILGASAMLATNYALLFKREPVLNP